MQNRRLYTMIGIASLALAPERAQAIMIDFGSSMGTPMLIESDHYGDQGLVITDNGAVSGMCSGLQCSWLIPSIIGGTDIDGLYLNAMASDPGTETTFMLFFGDGATDISFDYATSDGGILMSSMPTVPDLEADSATPFGNLLYWGQVSLQNEEPIYELQISALNSGQLILDNVGFSQAIPEPSAALMFGIGALVTSRGLRRPRSARTRN